ncbi:MAG: hypothetical protein OXF08_09575 [Bacteroidetes bacterium]|nr:hypothetical protein [Bacteroidota bacterium]
MPRILVPIPMGWLLGSTRMPHYSPEDSLFVFHMQDDEGAIQKVHYSNP